MSYENLRLQVPNLARVAGYFYTIDSGNDILYKKIDSGENAFSYPLDTDITNPVLSLQWDGNHFYSLECTTSGNGSFQIKKWKISDYLLKLQQVYSFVGSAYQKFDTSAFAVENFQRQASGGILAGTTHTFYLKRVSSDLGTSIAGTSRLKPGDTVTFGPSTSAGYIGKTETKIINTVDSGTDSFTITDISGTSFAYDDGDQISIVTNAWVFNKYRPGDSIGNGQLFSFDLNQDTPTLIPRASRAEFKSVLASTFLRDTDYPGGPREFLAYVKDTNILYLEVDSANTSYLSASESATQNNQRTNGTIIPIYDITCEGRTIFRLQQEAKIRTSDTTETDINWSPYYNYQISTLQRLPASISLTATPAVIPVNEVGYTTSKSNITALVKDQFDQPITHKVVRFTDDDSQGTITATAETQEGVANGGKASAEYTAGSVSRLVTITASTT